MKDPMREKLLKKMARWHAIHPWRMLTIVFILTILFVGLSTQLTHTMRWSDLLPSGDRRTIEYNKILEEFVTASSIIVVVQGEEKQIKAFAEVAVPKILAAVDTSKNDSIAKQVKKLKEKIARLQGKGGGGDRISSLISRVELLQKQMNRKIVQRIDYKTEVDFLGHHGLMLVKAEDLENMKEMFTNPNLPDLLTNINNSMEKEYVGREESISTREKEDQAVIFLDGIEGWISIMHRYARGETVTEEEAHTAVDKLLLGESYFLSYNKKALILNVIPYFTVMDVDLLVSGTKAIQNIVDDVLQDYPDVTAGLTGMIPLCHDEMVYSRKSLGYTSVIAFTAILIMLILSFRMWVAPILAIVNLLIGTLWAVGTATVLVGQLNIMTSMFAVILIGLGIDFSIHIIAGFTERRSTGENIGSAMEETFLKSGKGVVTGALTTACAFLTLIISSSRGMKEMGLVMGTGLLTILVATFLLLPSLLVLRERHLDRRREMKIQETRFVQRDISFRFLGRSARWLSNRYAFTIGISIVVTVLLVCSALNIPFDQNYMNIEPEGLTSIVLQDTVLEKFDLSMDYALILADNVDESRTIAKRCREMGSVARTEDISLYLPSPKEQQERTPYLNEIRQAMGLSSVRIAPFSRDEFAIVQKEIERLEMNVMEMQDMAFLGGQDKVDRKCSESVGHPDKLESRNLIRELLNYIAQNPDETQTGLTRFQRQYAPYFKDLVLNMCSTDPIRLEDLPESVLDRYSNEDRSLFLVTVFPAGNIWQSAQFLHNFTDDLERSTDKATGMPPVFRALIDIIGRDGRTAALLTLIIIFLLLWLDFKKPGHALIAMIPLAAGLFWMVGLMNLVGLQLTVMNVMGIPMILGIGIDDGVHIVHRWRIEGKGKVRIIFASTGKAILLTSLTTMLAFGSLIFSIWRGFGQLGNALFIGVASCFLTTVIILSGIIGLLERKSSR